MHKDPSTTYITFILVETNQPEAGFIFTLSEFALVLSCGFFLSRCSESCFESRCFPLPVQIRNSVTKPTSWIIHRFKKQICKRLCSRCGHGCERGGVEERGGFKFLHSFFWFEVKLNQRRAELRSHGRSCPSVWEQFSLHAGLFVLCPRVNTYILGVVFFFFVFAGEWRWPLLKAARQIGTDRWSWSWKWRLLSRRNAARSGDSSRLLSETWK